MLGKIVSFVAPDDELAAALACRKLRDVLDGGGRSRTTATVSLLSSPGKLRWGVSCGAPLNARLYSRAASGGDRPVLDLASGRPLLAMLALPGGG